MPRIRWLLIFMCFLANVINFIDRANLAVASQSIRSDLGIDATEVVLILSAFFWTYAFLQLPAGWFIGKVGVLALAYASLSFAGANVWAVASEIAPTPNHVASIGGIQNFAGNLAGILITTFTGVMLTITKGSFPLPLSVAGALCVVGALSYLFIVGKVELLPALNGRSFPALSPHPIQ